VALSREQARVAHRHAQGVGQGLQSLQVGRSERVRPARQHLNHAQEQRPHTHRRGHPTARAGQVGVRRVGGVCRKVGRAQRLALAGSLGQAPRTFERVVRALRLPAVEAGDFFGPGAGGAHERLFAQQVDTRPFVAERFAFGCQSQHLGQQVVQFQGGSNSA
jgi:hypothetical protein